MLRTIFKKLVKPNELGIGVFVFVLVTLLVVWATSVYFTYDRSMFEGIAVEVHGMLFDLLVIGVFTLWLNLRVQKSKVVSDYLEQIDDFRTWKSEEASYRIAGIVKRLSNKGYNKIDLYQCSLRSTQIRNILIEQSNCWAVNFTDSNLKKVSFNRCKMKGAGFNRVIGSEVSFENCFLLIGKFDSCKLNGANFTESKLRRCSFKGASLKSTNFRRCDCEDAVFEDADLSGANFEGAIGLTPQQLFKAKSIRNIVLDEKLVSEIESISPNKISEYRDSDGTVFKKVIG